MCFRVFLINLLTKLGKLWYGRSISYQPSYRSEWSKKPPRRGYDPSNRKLSHSTIPSLPPIYCSWRYVFLFEPTYESFSELMIFLAYIIDTYNKYDGFDRIHSILTFLHNDRQFAVKEVEVGTDGVPILPQQVMYTIQPSSYIIYNTLQEAVQYIQKIKPEFRARL